MTETELMEERAKYKILVNEINSICGFLRKQKNFPVKGDTIGFIQQTALVEAQKLFYQPK